MSKGYPSMLALLGLVAVAGYQNRDKIAEMLRAHGTQDPRAPGQGMQQAGQGMQQGGFGTQQQGGLGTQQGGLGGLGGLLGSLGGAVGGAGAGGLLSTGLGELMDRFRQSGRGEVAQSWVNHGPNQDIAPHELKSAIGPDVLDELSHRTGLSQEELLTRLSQQLPAAVDKYTPDGRLPA
jgi:uncharacterized protein YidB (DUF937 family)